MNWYILFTRVVLQVNPLVHLMISDSHGDGDCLGSLIKPSLVHDVWVIANSGRVWVS